MSKQYGLILPGQQKKPAAAVTREPTRPSIFDEESSSDSDQNAPPQLRQKARPVAGPGAMERRIARKVQEKALEEDPTVFQYDELYDDMESKREEEKQSKAKEPKKPKYIARLLETAERRKLENELRTERQVQKEREAEGEQFKDKESFVTAAYRKKLEDMRKLEEQEKRDEYLEAIGDVTKQQDLDGFYRHLYEQKMSEAKVQKPNTTSGGDEEIAYKPIKSEKAPQRAYRKRHSSDEECAENLEAKKVHLPNNIDADSDFSIDSSDTSDEEVEKDGGGGSKSAAKKETRKELEPKKPSIKCETKDGVDKTEKKIEKQSPQKDIELSTPTIKPPKPKVDIWKKRTVGEVFDAAVQRYFERKAARSA